MTSECLDKIEPRYAHVNVILARQVALIMKQVASCNQKNI